MRLGAEGMGSDRDCAACRLSPLQVRNLHRTQRHQAMLCSMLTMLAKKGRDSSH